MAIRPAITSKRVMVIGGGPAGMEAAVNLRLRGHEVYLFERSDQLGGNALIAGIPNFKKDIERLIRFYRRQIDALDIHVQFRTDAQDIDISEFKPDAIIVAVGADYFRPSIEGLHSSSTITASEALISTKISGNVIVIGAGLIGVETAIHLKQKFRELEVTVLELQEEPLHEALRIDKLALMEIIDELGIKIVTGACVTSVGEKSVNCTMADGQVTIGEADTIVLAVGFIPKKVRLKFDPNIEIHFIGDCRMVGKIYDAIDTGAFVGLRKI